MTHNILMAQMNCHLGDIEKNTKKIIDIIINHQKDNALIVFPELCITGYPPEDLLYRDELHGRVRDALAKICHTVKACHVIVGHPTQEKAHYYNSASVIYQGEIKKTYHKQFLPNYSVFDEKRYFSQGSNPCVFTIDNHHYALCICEDAWHEKPIKQAIAQGATTLLCINASPFYAHKYQTREKIIANDAKMGLNIIYVNMCGGQDELVFDGQSFAIDSKGKLFARAPAFIETNHQITLDKKPKICPLLSEDEQIYQALVCGTKDYVNKNGFNGVLLGLSGGIDSALTLAIAVDALGEKAVTPVLMPSQYTQNMSIEDATEQARLLKVDSKLLEIKSIFEQFLSTLSDEFTGLPVDTTEENIQARIRGTLLMALSNKFRKLVLTTGNKSEMAVGYATLYGDMAGGFAVLKDIPKTKVYQLANYRNRLSHVIPQRVIKRAPSAELAPNQKDQDSLPSYDTLDKILYYYVEKDLSINQIITKGFEKKDVTKVVRLIDINEYKRRQAPPGVRISKRAFGRDWRYPITSGFHDFSNY
jgi:NAD+ synthase (glutamine-hydrolysing)